MTTSPAEPVPEAEQPAAAATEQPAPAAAEPAAAEPAAAEPAAAQPAAAGTEKTTDIVPGPGGVMTDEVGVVTGELTLRSELAGDQLTLKVQYKDADEWYSVTGGKATVKEPADLEAVHQIAVGLLHRPEG